MALSGVERAFRLRRASVVFLLAFFLNGIGAPGDDHADRTAESQCGLNFGSTLTMIQRAQSIESFEGNVAQWERVVTEAIQTRMARQGLDEDVVSIDVVGDAIGYSKAYAQDKLHGLLKSDLAVEVFARELDAIRSNTAMESFLKGMPLSIEQPTFQAEITELVNKIARGILDQIPRTMTIAEYNSGHPVAKKAGVRSKQFQDIIERANAARPGQSEEALFKSAILFSIYVPDLKFNEAIIEKSKTNRLKYLGQAVLERVRGIRKAMRARNISWKTAAVYGIGGYILVPLIWGNVSRWYEFNHLPSSFQTKMSALPNAIVAEFLSPSGFDNFDTNLIYYVKSHAAEMDAKTAGSFAKRTYGNWAQSELLSEYAGARSGQLTVDDIRTLVAASIDQNQADSLIGEILTRAESHFSPVQIKEIEDMISDLKLKYAIKSSIQVADNVSRGLTEIDRATLREASVLYSIGQLSTAESIKNFSENVPREFSLDAAARLARLISNESLRRGFIEEYLKNRQVSNLAGRSDLSESQIVRGVISLVSTLGENSVMDDMLLKWGEYEYKESVRRQIFEGLKTRKARESFQVKEPGYMGRI